MVLAFLHPALLPWCRPSSLPSLPSSLLFSAPHPPFSPVGIPVCMLRICLSAGCFLQVRVMGWRFHGLTLTFPARTCPQIFLVLWVSMWCPPSPPQCFDFSYSFFLEMDGSRCQDFKYIVWMERRKGIELLGWEVITAPFKLGF